MKLINIFFTLSLISTMSFARSQEFIATKGLEDFKIYSCIAKNRDNKTISNFSRTVLSTSQSSAVSMYVDQIMASASKMGDLISLRAAIAGDERSQPITEVRCLVVN